MIPCDCQTFKKPVISKELCDIQYPASVQQNYEQVVIKEVISFYYRTLKWMAKSIMCIAP